MLNEMNNQIYKRLDLKKGQNLVIDLGCGMGGTMRHFLNRNKDLQILGITRAPFQVTEGNKLLKKHHAVIINKDSTKMNITDRTVGGCIGIESLCHSGHSYKSLKEAFRILKPGGKFVIGDAFIKKAQENLCVGSSYSYKNLCKGWSLDALGLIQNVEEKLLAIGFKQVTIEDISIRVAPSVLHVPFAITAFLLKSLFSRKNVKPQSWNNLKASFFALLSGLHIKDFGYYLITATK
jgi:ubiquinone/menaquinone biosynthesis C-methylase UbiE